MAAETAVVTFDSGAEGWVGPTGPGGATTIEALGGNPNAHMHTVFNDFGITFFNNSNGSLADVCAEGPGDTRMRL